MYPRQAVGDYLRQAEAGEGLRLKPSLGSRPLIPGSMPQKPRHRCEPPRTWTSKRAPNNGPISQNREYRQYRVHYFGHFGGPRSCTRSATCDAVLPPFPRPGRTAHKDQPRSLCPTLKNSAADMQAFKQRHVGIVCSFLDHQNGQNNGPYTAYTLCFGILGHSELSGSRP